MANESSSLRTTFSRINGLGAAHHGTDHFWRQRLTAVANVLLIVPFVIIVLAAVGQDYARALAVVSHPLSAIVLSLLVISVAIHMRLGMTVVIEDYIHDKGLKVLAIMANTFFCASVGFAAIFAIIKLSLSRVV